MAQATAAGQQYQPILDADGQPVKLGAGSYSVVYRYRDTTNNEDVAVKRVALTGLAPHKADLLRRYLPTELENHYLLNHPHVVKLRDVFLTDDHLNIVLELAEHGTLFQQINRGLRENRGPMQEADARWLFQQIILTMDYFHRRGVAHRDIKLENTLLKSLPGWAQPIIKVADWGLSKHDAGIAYSRVGSAAYMSPEVITAQHPWPEGTGLGAGYSTEKADIWSTGVMLYAMLVGHYPFDANLPDQQRLQLMTSAPLQLPAHLSRQGRHLLEVLLHPNPVARITIQGIKQHPWFLQDLPPRALRMNDIYTNSGSPCKRSTAELRAIIERALARLQPGPSSYKAQQPDQQAVGQVGV